MNKKYKIIFTLFGATVISVLFSAFSVENVMKSDGGPPYNANAPGEKTCSGTEGTSSCHTGGIADNAGSAIKTISFSGGATYVAGQTYTVTVTISHPTRNRFGFQIVSLKNSDDANVGTVTLTDIARTTNQIPTYGSFQTRNYVMHILNGSYGTSNSCSWSYSWTAPSTSQGDITFYACFMAANNNNTNDSGDETYFTQLTISPGATGINEEKKEVDKISLYPNPVRNNFKINTTVGKPSSFKAELLNAEGKLVQLLYMNEKAEGTIDQMIALAKNVTPGNYFVKFTIDDKQLLKKIVVIGE